MKTKIGWTALLLLLLSMSLSNSGVVFAHERFVVGDYLLVIGWVEEPPVVGLKNGVWIKISRETDDSAVTGAEATLEIQVKAGDQSKDLLLRPLDESEPGVYAADFIPTRRGTYTVVLNGAIGDQTVDLSADIEEVFPIDVLQFPEASADAGLQQSVDALRSEVNSARTFGVAGLVVGALGLVLAAVALGRKR